jgi:hypothetical protein
VLGSWTTTEDVNNRRAQSVKIYIFKCRFVETESKLKTAVLNLYVLFCDAYSGDKKY